MRAFLQKLRASTSSKATGSSYPPSSKELEKEKRFPPLPEWPPPALNTVKEPILTVPTTTPIPLTLDTTNATTQRSKSPSSQPPSFYPPFSIYTEDDLPPPVPPASEKRQSNASTLTEVAKRLPPVKDTLGARANASMPPPAANNTTTASSSAAPKTNGTTTSAAPAEERKKGSMDSTGHNKSAVSKLVGTYEGRGSSASNQTAATKVGAPTKSASVRALTVTSPTPLSSSGHHGTVNVPPHLHHRPPHSSGKYNSMGMPMADNVSLIRAGSPMSHMSQRTAILTTASWSEAAEEDLVFNLGQRERTRQEVLWEIVASEQRYVHELMQMKETFIDPLLHPFAVNPLAAQSEEDYYQQESPVQSIEHLPIASRFLSPSIRSPTPNTPDTNAAHRITANTTPQIPTPEQGESDSDDEYTETSPNAGKLLGRAGKKTSFALSAAQKANHPRSPYGTASRATGEKMAANPRIGRITAASSRSHQSLPPPPRASAAGPAGATSATSLGRKANKDNEKDEHGPSRPATTEPTRHDRHAHFAPSPPPQRVLIKPRRESEDKPKLVAFPGAVPPHVLPEDLRKCLEVIENGILIGHLKLSEALRKRYDEQYPLVRSLADVFVGNSDILHEYATYVLHLERALEQIDECLNRATIMKRSRQPENTDQVKVAKLLAALEKEAMLRGETGLAISLSKPFQRLLKYPLLFQNLLFHTDPSTFEYESTLEMVSEVESIVRSIEDEKIQKEERDKTRDALARIDGLERDKVLAVFKPSRLLVDEKPQPGSFADPTSRTSPTSPPPASFNNDRGVKQKSSFRRISNVLGSKESKDGLGSKRDLWEVAFNDVVLLCQRTGTTTLPLSTTANTRANSLPDKEGKSKHGKRAAMSQNRARNMYRFLKVQSWTINEKPKPRELVSKEAIERWRNQQASGHIMGPDDAPEEEAEGADSDDSDRKSKMSFSYWGADKVTLTKPMAKRGVPTNASRTAIRTKLQAPSSFAGRQSDKESKFGGRLRSPEPSHDGSVVGTTNRPISRRTNNVTASPTTTRRNITSAVDSKLTTGSMTSVVSSRPGWDGSTRAAAAAGTASAGGPPAKRVRNLSVTSNPPNRVGNAKTLSAVPSEDSGVGMYRQIIAHDPSISTAKS